ncbi:hypothetical protein DVH02_01405 [Streptomyces corynorhini]|uniref:Uncharacterized protein n=1 Tax=Streptomyces corynorhini TaxID=2282652 RepID=A0A370BDR1_9ACTN|nr:hypothetical protein DVH02_01405 [Streptomyces corynorhini]
MPLAYPQVSDDLVGARIGRSCQASAGDDDLRPQSPAREPAPRQERPRAPGRPWVRAVIVLTVKLFGETLESPRTSAVWQ